MNKPFVEKPVHYSGAYSEEAAKALCEEELKRLARERRQWEEEQDKKDRQLQLKLE